MGFIPEDIIEQVKDRSDIVDIIGSYVALKPAGRNFKALSPFTNEKTASFIVSPDKQIYHCFSTGKGGNVITFIMMQERLNFPEAVRFLANKVGIEVPETGGYDSEFTELRNRVYEMNQFAVNQFHQTLLTAKDEDTSSARTYLKDRGISLSMVKDFKIGFAFDRWDELLKVLREKGFKSAEIEKAGLILSRRDNSGFYDRFRGRVIFPIFDYQGKPVAFGARSIKADEGAKYINSPDTPVYTKGRHLYGFHLSKEFIAKADEIIVVEGYMDFIMPYQAGVQNCVASLGTALTVDQIRLIRRYTHNVTMLYDTDKAGQNAMLRSIDLLIEEDMNVKIVQLAQGEDPDSFIRQYGVEEFREKIAQSKNWFEYMFFALLNKNDPRTKEGQEKICDGILPYINKVKNNITQSSYIKQISLELNVREHELHIRMKQMQSQPQYRDASVKEAKPQESLEIHNVTRQPEGQLLQLMFQSPDYVKNVKEMISLEQFTHTIIRQIYAELYDRLDKGQPLAAADMINQFHDPMIQSVISQCAAEEQYTDQQARKILKDCTDRIQRAHQKTQRQQLIFELRQAERDGNQVLAQELKQKINELIKR